MSSQTRGYQGPAQRASGRLVRNKRLRSPLRPSGIAMELAGSHQLLCGEVQQLSIKPGGSKRTKTVALAPIQTTFDDLPDDLVVIILTKLSQSALSSADLVSSAITCRRLCSLVARREVLQEASAYVLAVPAIRWCPGAHRFLFACAKSGNMEACYRLGMIKFYCLEETLAGANLLARAAMAGHPEALCCLANIHFNGSGGQRSDRDPTSGVVLCAKAAALGHLEGLRELGYCLIDSYGVTMDLAEGHRILQEARARELTQLVAHSVVVPQRKPASPCQLLLPSEVTNTGAAPSTTRSRIADAAAALVMKLKRISPETPPSPSPSGLLPTKPGDIALEAGIARSSSIGECTNVQEQVFAAGGTPIANGTGWLLTERASTSASPFSAPQLVVSQVGASGAAAGRPDLGGIGKLIIKIPQKQALAAQAAVAASLEAPLPEPASFRAPPQPPSAHSFLVEWRTWVPLKERLEVCYNKKCSRPESRINEFRCCSACGLVKYCSRYCQGQDWRVGHKAACQLAMAMDDVVIRVPVNDQ